MVSQGDSAKPFPFKRPTQERRVSERHNNNNLLARQAKRPAGSFLTDPGGSPAPFGGIKAR
jgi:hypothetical protein